MDLRKHGKRATKEAEEAAEKEDEGAIALRRQSLTGRRLEAAHQGANYLFYTNQLSSKPRGGTIREIHETWDGDYELLERHHGYIQWLFPLYEGRGMNGHSQRLEEDEATAMRETFAVGERIVRSYRMMLAFYGMALENELTGRVIRHPDGRLRKEQYKNLRSRSHNFLRISRILASLGHLGFARYKAPFLRHLQQEVEGGSLRACHSSLVNFWQPLVDDPPYPEEAEQEHVYLLFREHEIVTSSEESA